LFAEHLCSNCLQERISTQTDNENTKPDDQQPKPPELQP
jgi:hypothetical protein